MGNFIAMGLALYSFALVQSSVGTLPARIPTHFNSVGEPNGWGSPDVLWLILLMQVFTCGIFLLVPPLSRRFPESVHFGARRLSDFTPEQQERLLPLVTEMTGAMSAPLGLLFSYLIHEMIRVASSSHPNLSLAWAMALFLPATAAIVIYYLRRIYAIGNETAATPRSAG